ncbi:coiled-coil domain-containing protein 73-like isoform X3 [Scyliorhinus canicula]|uniref:coiled-coil domain-containing protein 73-like isoform X3 n=1 Tax=Scyliorhinus canicula TaxID=7830 RepID=UPI0018F36B3E|nr:coiled-coil domain-containing protein 73-like isoform X3 [Scyliorhinus canicula]
MENKKTPVSKDPKGGLCITYDFQNSDTAALRSVQQLEFKTSLLEVVEELRIRRVVESRYEEQISNLVVEKQELEWQKESLQHQCNALSSQHEEAMAVLKKQFQTRVNAVEEEKGKFQLTAESKEREINGLKEELKILQVSKYSLEKKLNELEQRVQLQTVAKDNQLSQLSEVEKRFAAISRQCGLVKQAHEKLGQNVEEATRLNKKLMMANKNQENVIHDLKQELEKVTADLIRSKVTSQCKLGEENIHLTAQQQTLQELKRKLQMETELNKRLSKSAFTVQEEKQEVLKLLQQTQQLLQRQELALHRTEKELKVSGEKYQILESDNELLREKAKEDEDKFQILERENEKSTAQWKKEEARLNEENQLIKSEFESCKEDHAERQEIYNKLSAQNVQQQQKIQILQNNLEHFEQHTAQKPPGQQTCVKEALIVNDNKVKETGMHNTIEEKIKDEFIKREFKNQEISNYITNSNVLPPDTAKPAAEMPEKTTDNGALFVNERQYTSVSTVNINVGEPSDIQQDEIRNTCYDAESASAKLKSQCTSVYLAEVPVKGGKMLPDSADALGVCSADIGQQTDSITHKFDGGKSEAVYDTNDKTKTTQCDKGVFINEPPRTEARAIPGTDEILARKVNANEVRQDTNQTQHQSVSDIVFQPVTHENKNERQSSLQQDEHRSQANTLMEGNCTSSNIVECNQFHKSCSKSDVSSTKLPTDQCNQCVPPFAACKINRSVYVDTKPQSGILVEIRDLGSMEHEEYITTEISSNAPRNLRTDDQQKEPHDLETVISNCEAIEDLQATMSIEKPLGNLKKLHGNLAQINDYLSVTSSHSLNFITKVDHSMVLVPNSQSMEKANGSANDSEATVEIQQAAVSKMDLHAEIPEASGSSKITENEFKPIIIGTSVNPIATITLDHRNTTSTSETESVSNKAATSQSGWTFCGLPILDSGKGKDMLNKAPASLPMSLPRDKLEAPVINRRFPSAFTFPREVGEISLKSSNAEDSPTAKRFNDTFNTSSVALYPKRNSNVEWNATARTFSDFLEPPEQEKPCSSSSECFKIPYSPISMKYQGQFAESASITCSQSSAIKLPEVSMPDTQELLFEEECDSQYSTIKGQISKIERFLSLDRLKHTRKRKADDSIAESIIKVTPI